MIKPSSKWTPDVPFKDMKDGYPDHKKVVIPTDEPDQML